MSADVFHNGVHVGYIQANAWHQPEQRGWHFLGKEEFYDLDDATGFSKTRYTKCPCSRSTLMRRWREQQRGPEFYAQLNEWRRRRLPCEDYLLPHELR